MKRYPQQLFVRVARAHQLLPASFSERVQFCNFFAAFVTKLSIRDTHDHGCHHWSAANQLERFCCRA